MRNFQREGAISNSHVGKDFEVIAFEYFKSLGWEAEKNYSIEIGFGNTKKMHRFDIGGVDKNGYEFVVECKSHKWTSGSNVPSAKMTVWNEAMLYFSLLSEYTKKYHFVLRDLSVVRSETLAEYYIRTYKHLIPKGVTIMEYNMETTTVNTIFRS